MAWSAIGPRAFGPRRDISAADMRRVVWAVRGGARGRTGSISSANTIREGTSIMTGPTAPARSVQGVAMTGIVVSTRGITADSAGTGSV